MSHLPVLVWGARASRAMVVVFTAMLLGACVTTPEPLSSPDPKAATPSTPSRGGKVLGENDRFVVFEPGTGDNLRSIAARFLGNEDQYWTIGDFNGIAQAQAGQPLVVPLRTLNPFGVQTDQYQTVPILCYHRFGSGGKMLMSPANFETQLDWLARNDYHVIRLVDLQAFLEGKISLPKRSVIITIDDGYESVYRYALPALKKHNFPATLFVYTDFVGAGDAVSWSQLVEIAGSGLVEIGAHSKTHRNLNERSASESESQYRVALETEARVPRDLLEKRLSVKVRNYAYPYGDANEMVLDALNRHQYQLAVTVNPGGNAFFAQPLMLRRTMIFGDHDLDAFKSKLQISRRVAGS